VAKEIKCSDLGVVGCDFVARGEAPGDVVEPVAEHLRSKHDLDILDADSILKRGVRHDLELMHKKDVLLVIERLRELWILSPYRNPYAQSPRLVRYRCGSEMKDQSGISGQANLKGKTAVVTGAGRGIGRAAALALARADADVGVQLERGQR
jgi:predicted small metal-binding protein